MDDLFGDNEVEQQQQQAEEAEAQDTLADDLFGDEQIVAPPSAQQQAPAFADYLGPADAELTEAQRALEYEEDFTQSYGLPQEAQSTIADLQWSNLPRPSSKGPFWHVKMPNFIRVDPNPFNPSTFSVEAEDAANNRGEGAASLPDDNVIRWRWVPTPEGSIAKQANARIVLWDDGSASLQLGSEFFDVTTNVDDSANPPPPGTKKLARPNVLSLPIVEANKDKPQGLTYLMVEHSYSSGVLQTQARISGTMAFTPSAINAKIHRKLANGVADRHVKQTRTVKMEVKEDPELEKAKMEATAAAKMKAAKKEAKKAAGGGKSRRKSMRSERLYSDSDMDEDEDRFADDGLDGGVPTFKKRNKPRYDEIEDDDGFVVPSDEEDAEGAGRRTTAQYDDDMDDIEAAAEQAERERRARKNPGAAVSGEAAMDIDAPEPTKRRLVIEGSDEE